MAHAVEDKEDKEEPKYQFMLTLKYKHDQVTNDSVQGYIKKQLKCTNMHHITVPINIQDIIMHFYSKEQFDKHGEILSLNLMKNQVEYCHKYYDQFFAEYCHYEHFFIYNSVWCRRHTFPCAENLKLSLQVCVCTHHHWIRSLGERVCTSRFQ